MPPTFLLYLLMVGLAFLALIIVAASIVLVCLAPWRPLGTRLLLWSSIGGIAGCAAWFVAVVIFAGAQSVSWELALGAFGVGFSGGAFSLVAWQLWCRVLSNPLMQPTSRERPAAD
ncbi:MAG: hypothetical protein ACI9W2_003794 [Gammaproteobacteria bacterium]|jgi:hypothetical protein